MKNQKIRGVEDWKIGNDKMMGCPTKAFGHDRRCGFTLVELVIVIAIVIILSVISVPIYRGYVDKAKWTEGYALVGTIMSAQKSYYAEYGNFLRSGVFTSNYPVLGIDARTNKYFTFFHVGGGNLTDEEYNPKIYCYSCVRMPKELCEDDGQWWLQMSYYTNKPTSVFTTKWE